MRDRLLLLSLAASAILIASETPKNGAGRHSFPLQPGGRVSIETTHGSATHSSVEISGWDQESVEIAGGSWDSLNQGDATLRIQGLAGDNSEAVQIHVPRRVTLDAVASTNGWIRVSGIVGDVSLKSSNGGIEASDVHGLLTVHSSNGAIVVRGQDGSSRIHSSNGGVEIGAVSAAPLDVHTSNGPIVVRMPASLHAQPDAHTSNGNIQSDFDVKPGVIKRNQWEGVIGGGGPMLKLSSSNGAIQLLRDKAQMERVTSTFTPGPVQ